MQYRLGTALLISLAALMATSADARSRTDTNAPSKVYSLVVYGDDPCPQGQGDEVVVCARKPESERYRIPKPLREKPEVAGGPGWGSQVAGMEDVQRQYIPGSCSVIGSNGFTGCTQAMLKQWFAERRMQQSAGVP